MSQSRFDVPGFPDQVLLRKLVAKARLARFNGLVLTGLLALAIAGFVGWVFSLSKIMQQREWCTGQSSGLQSGRELCEKRVAELKADGVVSTMSCDDVRTDLPAFDYCMDPDQSTAMNEQEQFGAFAAALGGLGLLLIAGGITWRALDVPGFLKVLRDPRRIVWIYESNSASGRYGVFCNVVLALDSKETCTIHVGNSTSDGGIRRDLALAQEAVATISRWAPWAAVGGSAELAARFQYDPASCRVTAPPQIAMGS